MRMPQRRGFGGTARVRGGVPRRYHETHQRYRNLTPPAPDAQTIILIKKILKNHHPNTLFKKPL